MKTLKFNDGFMWGSATSGPQTESSKNRSATVWDVWHKEQPELFFDGNKALGNLEERYVEYVLHAKNAGFNSLRVSIQWSRLMPNGKDVSESGVEFYKKYFTEIRKQGMKVMVNLMHFDTPEWLYRKGGFETKESIEAYVEYASNAFEIFDEYVDVWFTFNEPIVPVEMGYLNKYHLPAIVDMKKAWQVQFNLLICHMKAVEIFKEKGYAQEIGIILNITPVIPATESDADKEASKWAEQFQFKCFLDPILKGEVSDEFIQDAKQKGYFWEITDEEQKLIDKKLGIDLLGINYYAPKRVQTPKSKEFNNNFAPDQMYYEDFIMPNRRINKHRGWEIFPEAIYIALKNIQENYSNQKVFISENGIGIQDEARFKENGKIDDQYRIEFMKEHLFWIHKAIQEGANCVGYHMWTYIDNWSWLNAYKNRYGLYEFDLETNEIKAKTSAKWFAKTSINNLIEIKENYEKNSTPTPK
ncbi:glycoside hydrolase family 1 protein [Mycoplasma todarodis]|uniref:glycoside hydrolase family 1 protein n=1 Tax=Mycoplasma todarodis TaxID=1937191 RepID=UPI003B30C9B4